MKSFKRSHFAVLACGVAVGLVSASCSSGGASPANAYVTSGLGYAVDSEGNIVGHCPIMSPEDTPFLQIGTQVNPIPDNGNYVGSVVTVTCEVQATGTNTYNVNAQVTEGTLGSFNFSGTVTNTMGMQTGVQAGFFESPNGFNESDCMLQLYGGGFDTSGTPSATNPSITAGRIWATLMCPDLTNLEDNATCGGHATFILQNCSD